MTRDAWVDYAAIGGFVVVLLGLAYRYVVLPIRRLDSERDQRFSDWYGTPARPGVARVPGVMERISTTETVLDDTVERVHRLETVEKLKSHEEAIALYRVIEAAAMSKPPKEAHG